MSRSKNDLKNSRAWVKRLDQKATGNMRVNVAQDIAKVLGMNAAHAMEYKQHSVQEWASEVNVGSYEDILDTDNKFVLSLLGELDTYKKWVDNIFVDIDDFSIRHPELREQVELFNELLKNKDIYKLPALVMMQGLQHNALIERFMQEQAKYHMSAKSKGLTPKNSHYLVNQNWQTIAKQELTAIDVAAVIPETSPLIRDELGITEVSNEDLPDHMEKAEQVVKDRGMTNTEWLDTLIELQNSVPYLWVDETLDMATKMPLPEHTVDETLMPIPFMFFTFEKPVYFGDYMGRRYMTFLLLTANYDQEQDEITYINWCCDSRDLNYFRDYVDKEGICEEEHHEEMIAEGDCSHPPYRFLQPPAMRQDWLEYGHIECGTSYPLTDDTYTGDPKKKAMNDFIADGVIRLLNFLKTTAVTVETEGLPRSMRRDKNLDTTTRKKELNVIKLRRTKYKGKYLPKGDGTGKSIQFEGTWWVTGHYRNQRHGLGRSKTKVIWIDPFMKGQGKTKKQLYKVVQ